ncbi:MAG TPA: ergothioneine biosynthesis protein EgtB [Alphaproteobacteria bacterium]|nr:ergothioneine biosynthesis protein EgtB [Alphaproteobacteria bacterium]
MATRAPVRPIEREDARATLGARLQAARARTLALAARLSPEDQQAQSMADASPTKWHLAHTTWFFETFVLAPNVAGFRCFDEAFGYLFNSYYESVGARHPRPARGLLTRPPLARILDWRARTEDELSRFVDTASDDLFAAAAPMVDLGTHHEEQHQELILMDALHLLSVNPLAPAYADGPSPLTSAAVSSPLRWLEIEGGLVHIGHDGAGFAFDNECPRHKVWLEDFALADRLVTNGEFLEFIDSGGYRDPLYWLSDGWAWVASEGAEHPIYWREQDGRWTEFTLHGRIPLDPARPVAHLSYFESDAYARFRGARLPTEAEWEHAAECGTEDREANLLDGGALVALPAPAGSGLRQTIGDLWEWTASAYSPYPGFVPAVGAVGEYNGKFMSGQMVLRGGSFATPAGHIRPTYRNFFYPHQRWMFSGLRLARDV